MIRTGLLIRSYLSRRQAKLSWHWPLALCLIASIWLETRARCEKGHVAAPFFCAPQIGYLLECDGAAVPYFPKPGDILLCDEFNAFHHFVYKMVGTGPPTHSAMVIAHEEGRPALLDLYGPTVRGAKVIVLEASERMHSYCGSIMIRRLRCPLSEDRSCDLTRFARSQEGRDFAYCRVIMQASPFRPRHGLRREVFGRTYYDRHRWLCSELVVSAACVAGILDPKVYPANAIYPRDLAFDEEIDLSSEYEPAAPWVAFPDAPPTCQTGQDARLP